MPRAGTEGGMIDRWTQRIREIKHRHRAALTAEIWRDRVVADWMAGEDKQLGRLHLLLYEGLAPDDASDTESDSEAWRKACCLIEAQIFRMPATQLSVHRAELWRQEFGGGWDASWRMLLGPYRTLLAPGRAAELEAEAERTFDREFLSSWGITPWST